MYSQTNQQEEISIVENAENCESDSSLRIHDTSPHDNSGDSWCPGDHCGEGGASEKRVMWHDKQDFTSGSVSSGDECDLYQDSRVSLQSHRRSTDHGNETEESYFVTRDNNDKWNFTCKICEASFASQKSVKQHNMAKHGGRWWDATN